MYIEEQLQKLEEIEQFFKKGYKDVLICDLEKTFEHYSGKLNSVMFELSYEMGLLHTYCYEFEEYIDAHESYFYTHYKFPNGCKVTVFINAQWGDMHIGLKATDKNGNKYNVQPFDNGYARADGNINKLLQQIKEQEKE